MATEGFFRIQSIHMKILSKAFIICTLAHLVLSGNAQTVDKTENMGMAKPTPLQMEWQKLEKIAFIHFSINTFTDLEWGYGNESPALFNPTRLDCRQWVKICKDAGMKGVILTAKHHDGFCLWPSEYTGHSVKNSPWKNGKGDVVREFADACREYGLKMGLYLSPWDCNNPDYGKPEYNRYFKNQLTELLTNYGELFEIWFDGANGGRGYYGTDSLHTRSIPDDYYDWEGFAGIVRKLQPNCIIHGGGLPDIRWVGNEEGHAGETHWSTMKSEDSPEEKNNHLARLNTGYEDGNMWLPSETDVSVRPGWYYHASEDHKVKSLPQLMDIYYESAGRNSLLLLNLSPDKRGLICSADSARLMEWKQQLDLDLGKNLVTTECTFSARDSHYPGYAFDDNYYTYWQANENYGYLEVDFGRTITCNRLLLQEFIQEGQKVRAFHAEYQMDGEWKTLARGTTIGYKRIFRFVPVKAQKIRLVVEDALAPPMISTIAVFNAPMLIAPPEIRRDQSGKVTIISAEKYGEIFYTTDGNNPGRNSNIYTGTFVADGNVTVKAVVFEGPEVMGDMAEMKFGNSKASWKVVGDTISRPALFDGNPATAWYSKPGVTSVVIDLTKPAVLQGLNYLPDQSRFFRGIALNYLISVSQNGKSWKPVSKGEFPNIRNHPVNQTIRFVQPVKGRFLKFETTSVADGQKVLGIGELDVIME